jgi:hypothetical protein
MLNPNASQSAMSSQHAYRCSHLSTLHDLDTVDRLVHLPGLGALDLLDDVVTLNDRAEDNVLAVQPRRALRGEEKLAAIRVWAGVRHAQQARLIVLQREVLVLELACAVDADRAGAVAVEEIPALDHELGDLGHFSPVSVGLERGLTYYAVNLASFIPDRFAVLIPRFSSAELAEILRGLWGHIGEKLHLDAAQRLP